MCSGIRFCASWAWAEDDMERIKEALEKAREARAHASEGARDPNQPKALKTKGGKEVDQLEYTRTRTVKVSRDFLREQRIISGFEQGILTEAYKMLRTLVLQKMRENGWNALAVTSPGGGEGKTLTAINLAISLAMEVDQTVLLVDADLRHPQMRQYFGLPDGPGLSDYLTKGTPLEEILVHPDIVGRFVLLPGGQPLQNSPEMLRSPKMVDLVQELKGRYPSRIVLFDLSPVLSVADVLAFSPYVDAALLVVEEAKTKMEDITRAASLLGSTHLIGTVLNKSLGTVPNKSLEPDARSKTPSSWIKRFFRRNEG